MAAHFASILEAMLDFSNVLNISICASWLVLAVLVLRIFLRKAPKWINVCLWGLVAIRLLLPVSIESPFSLIPSSQTIPRDIMISQGERLHQQARLDVITNPIYQLEVTTDIAPTIDRLQITMTMFTLLWLVGITVLLIYTAVTYWRLRKKVATAVIFEDNIFQSEYIGSPFVLGLLKPKIYLPYNMSEGEMNHVIAHERAHIRHRDHWWKPLGFLLLTLHWFNPLMWVAYILLCRDIELACDEKVIMGLSNEERANYTQALVACSVTRKTIAACPLAFGEVSVKERVRSVMNYKKPTFWILLAALAACAVAAVCFLTNPRNPNRHTGVAYHYGTVTDQAMSVIYEGSRESREYISLHGDNGENMLFWASESNTSAPTLIGKHVMVCSETEASTGLTVMRKVTITDNTWAYTAEEAIENAILDYNWSPRYEGMLQCADFVVLSNEVGGPADTNEIDTAVYYGLALHQVFSLRDGELTEEGGSHIPTVLTFAIDDSGRYILKEYWEPRDGSYYTSDIKEKFPAFVWPDTQKHIQRQKESNYAKAAEYYGLTIHMDELKSFFVKNKMLFYSEAREEDIHFLGVWNDFALVYYSGMGAKLALYQYYAENGAIAVKACAHGEYAISGSISINHVEWKGKHIYFGTLTDSHWNPKDDSTTLTNWDSIQMVDDIGNMTMLDVADAQGYLCVLDAPLADFCGVDRTGKTLIDMAAYLDQGYEIAEALLSPLTFG